MWRCDQDGRVGHGVAVSSRRGYPSALTDAQWDLVKDLLPEPSGDGRPENTRGAGSSTRSSTLVRSGCPWRYLRADLPPWQTVYWYCVRWEDAGVTENCWPRCGSSPVSHRAVNPSHRQGSRTPRAPRAPTP
ncbi:transposase [Actinoplanes sp. NPDC051343]|uniref:transposase n=1 Tax=Actinoplanes sp. NPDC051343 TaxID=3363906 RepID=UPI00378756B5